MQTITAIVARAFYSHALLPNFKKGKSEWMICLRGPNSLSVKRQIFVTQQAQVVCKVYENHSVTAHVVAVYKHLGNYATPDLKSNAHIQHRVSEGNSALIPLSRHVFFFQAPAAQHEDPSCLCPHFFQTLL